jgi:hypothetical protein
MRRSSPRLKEKSLHASSARQEGQRRTAAVVSHANRSARTNNTTMVLPPPIPRRGKSGSNVKEQTKQCKQSTMKKKRDKEVDKVNSSKERKEVVDDGDDEDHDDDVASFVSTLDQMPPEGSGGEEGASFKDVVNEGVNNASLEDGLHNDVFKLNYDKLVL